MKYLKVFVDFAKDIEMLGEAERGRLFTAMLKYASTGEEEDLTGNERFLWGTAKKQIDNQAEAYANKVEKMLEARKKRAVEIKENFLDIKEEILDIKEKNLDIRKKSLISGEEKDKDKDKDKDKERKENSLSKEREKKKRKFGAFAHVLLTDEEHQKLGDRFGAEKRDAAIDLLDSYIQEKGYKSKDHYLTILRWVMDALDEQATRRSRNSSPMNAGAGSYAQKKEIDEMKALYERMKRETNEQEHDPART